MVRRSRVSQVPVLPLLFLAYKTVLRPPWQWNNQVVFAVYRTAILLTGNEKDEFLQTQNRTNWQIPETG